MTAGPELMDAVIVSFEDARVDRRIGQVLDRLGDVPEYTHAVARSRRALTEFLRSWCGTGVPSRDRLTEWALDWLERRNDINEGEEG